MTLKNDLYSVDKKLLLKSGAKITQSALDRIAKSAKKIRFVRLKNTTLIKDMKRALRDKRYKIMFSQRKINKKIFNVVKQVSLPEFLLAELMDMKKKLPYTYHHVLIITIMAMKVALDKNLKGQYDPKRTFRLGLAHDIGKSRIPRKILNKSASLTRKERKIIRLHPLLGYILLHYYYGKNHGQYDYASYEHHERLDGSGYPRGLKKISKYSQLIAVIDTLDSLISERPYRKASYTLRAANDFLLTEAENGRLNKKIVYLLISYARKDKPLFQKLKVSKKWRDKAPTKNVYGKTSGS